MFSWRLVMFSIFMSLLAIHIFFLRNIYCQHMLPIKQIICFLDELFELFMLSEYLPLVGWAIWKYFCRFCFLFLCSVEFFLCNEIAFSFMYSHLPISAFAIFDLYTWIKSLLPLIFLWCLFDFPSNSFIISSFTFVFLSILSLYLYICYRFVDGIYNFLLCTWIHM